MNLRTLGVFVLGLLLLTAPTRADDASVPEGLAANDWSSIRAAYEAGRHAVVADENVPGHYRARNPGQQWLTLFDGRGFSTTPTTGGWSWGLDLISYGRGDQQQTIDGVACIQTTGGRVEYEWNPSLTEWYINDQRGFEHGYTLNHRPEGASGTSGMLHFTLAVRGDLHPRVSENGRDVAFTTASGGGATALTYNGLKVFDADGVHLAASFQTTTTAAGTPALRLTIDDTNARYPLTIDPVAQQAYLKASNTEAGDLFGISVAVSGDTVVVGASGEDSNATGVNGDQANDSADGSGAAYVFVRSGTTWTQQAYLKASNTGGGDLFGVSVAISGDTAVVGANGEDSSSRLINGNQGSNAATDSGAAYIFVRSHGGTTWTQQAYIKASNTDASDIFGSNVAVSGDTVVIGAYGEDSNATGVNGSQANNSAANAGAAYVFTRSGTTWTQQAYLKASNTGRDDYFGFSVAVSGDTVAVGANGESSIATGVDGSQFNDIALYSGAAYVFARPPGGTTWTQQAYLKASNTEASDGFGVSVAVSGDTVVVGAPYEDSNATGVNGNQFSNIATFAGAAYVFVRSGATWTQQAYVKASNTRVSDFFGTSVAVSGDTVVVGAYGEASSATGVDGNQDSWGSNYFGAAYVFSRSGSAWTQRAYLKASTNTGSRNLFGSSAAVSGDTVVVGAYGEASNATGVNGNEFSSSAIESGAAYVFVLDLPTPASPLASPASVCAGTPSTLSVADPGTGITIDWFTSSCGGTLIGTGNPFIVNPAAATTYFARARRLSDGISSDACASVVVTIKPADYNRDGFLNLDDLSDFITDFYMDPPIPGGIQPAAPTYADITFASSPCPNAPSAPAPYAADAYFTHGYRVSFSPDGSNTCPVSPSQFFPNLDHLADFITEYYAAFTAGGC
jgi:hypothetical protein